MSKAGNSPDVPHATPAVAPRETVFIRYERPRVWGHWLLAAAFLGAVWAVAMHITEVDPVAAAVLSLLVLALDGYGTIRRARRREPIVTLSPAGIAVHLPDIDPLPWACVRSARLGGNWITGKYLEVCHEAPLPPFGWQERLGFSITAKHTVDGICLNVGCLEQSDCSVEEIEAAIARHIRAGAGTTASNPHPMDR